MLKLLLESEYTKVKRYQPLVEEINFLEEEISQSLIMSCEKKS